MALALRPKSGMALSNGIPTSSGKIVWTIPPSNNGGQVIARNDNAQNTASFNFMGLPYELRSKVYGHCLAARTDGKRPAILHIIKGDEEYKDAVKQYKKLNFFLTITEKESNYDSFRRMKSKKELDFRHLYLKMSMNYKYIYPNGHVWPLTFNPFLCHKMYYTNGLETITIHLEGVVINQWYDSWDLNLAWHLIDASTRASTLVLRMDMESAEELQTFLSSKDELGRFCLVDRWSDSLRVEGTLEVDGQSVVCVWQSTGTRLRWRWR